MKEEAHPASNSNSLMQVIESYTRYYADGSNHTSRAKRLDLDHFVDFLQSYVGVSKPEKLTLQDWNYSSIQAFVDEKLRSGEAPSTVARRLATIKHMGRTLADKLPGFVNPAKEVKTPKVKSLKPKALEKTEISEIKNKSTVRRSNKDSFIRYRNETIFNFLIDTGLRADEVRLLRMGQLDENLEWIKNVRTKGRRYRNVYITSKMQPMLKEYLEQRTKELARFFPKLSKKLDKQLPVFISNYKCDPEKPDSFLMGAKSLWRAVNELSAETKLHPHLLRHSYAIELLDSSNDVRLVAQALGHSDVRVTMRYTERGDAEIAKALEKSRNS
ncbi:MAG: tyrosine-type recombinase/integrase [Deltaproteobacteria bacterium]|nr:tyrosine-type recombinase/integrase [Deltaproteobacteria bacterium]